MNHQNLELKLQQTIREERVSNGKILLLLNQADENRTHLELGYSSLHDWLITHFRYSEGAASRRVQAARMVRVVPDAIKKIEEGILNLTTLAMAESYTKGHSPEKKREIAQQLENKSSKEAQKILAKHYPKKPQAETYKAFDEEMARLSVNVPLDTIEKLQALRDEMSHKLKTIGEVIAELVAEKQCVTAKCTYQNPETGKVCGGTFLPQQDHIHPKALGGSNNPENKRPLCRAHNILVAEHAFGRDHMEQFKK